MLASTTHKENSLFIKYSFKLEIYTLKTCLFNRAKKEIQYKLVHMGTITSLTPYIKLLDFADFAVQSANSRIGPFASRVLNLNHLNHKKSENLQCEKCRYITGREKTFSDTAQ